MDINCPYCDAEQDIDHDDGLGYSGDELHQQECSNCEKIFVFTTYISFSYTPEKADCLNGGEHTWIQTLTFPKECTEMRCEMCDERRKPTDTEWNIILNR